MRFTKGEHAFIICTHVDKKHIHNHVYWNSTKLSCMGKFRNFWGSTKAVRELSDLICMEHRLSVISNPKRQGMSYNKWLSSRAKLSHWEEVRILIDEALAKKPHSMDALLELLSASGYEIKRGKNITLMKAGQKNIRLNSLGEGYTEKELFAVISGAKIHTPRKNRRLTAPRKAKLITEIEDKLNGRHSQWDSVRILKQMAQSVLYVQQHDFDTFDEAGLKKLPTVKSLNAEYAELLAQKKAAYAEYAEAKEMRELLVHKANVEYILGLEEQEKMRIREAKRESAR